MSVYRVRANMHGKRITTEKYWLKKEGASDYADITNKNFPGANAKVVKSSLHALD